jgi:hypothetical protein
MFAVGLEGAPCPKSDPFGIETWGSAAGGALFFLPILKLSFGGFQDCFLSGKLAQEARNFVTPLLTDSDKDSSRVR